MGNQSQLKFKQTQSPTFDLLKSCRDSSIDLSMRATRPTRDPLVYRREIDCCGVNDEKNVGGEAIVGDAGPCVGAGLSRHC